MWGYNKRPLKSAILRLAEPGLDLEDEKAWNDGNGITMLGSSTKPSLLDGVVKSLHLPLCLVYEDFYLAIVNTFYEFIKIKN
jgi:hypothetical protein